MLWCFWSLLFQLKGVVPSYVIPYVIKITYINNELRTRERLSSITMVERIYQRMERSGLERSAVIRSAKTRRKLWFWMSQTPLLIRANREDLPTTGEFTYLGNTVRHDGRANKDIKNRLVNAINVVRMLNYVWRSQQQSTKIRLKLYHSCVLSTLIYGSECWRMTEGDLPHCQSFTVFLNFVWDIWSSYSRGCHWKKNL